MPNCLNSLLPIALLGCLALTGCSSSSDPVAENNDPQAAAAESSHEPSKETNGTRAKKGSKLDSVPLEEPSHEYYPTVVLKTSLGDVTVKLDAKRAPRTVNNFLHYVENGHYNETIFHQIDSGYVVLGGSYTSELTEKGARYPIVNEADNGMKNVRGTIAMARRPDEIDSATCQFFINVNDNPNLDHCGDSPEEFGFCVFGEVIAGMEVVDKMSDLEVRDTERFEKLPVETVLLETARRIQ